MPPVDQQTIDRTLQAIGAGFATQQGIQGEQQIKALRVAVEAALAKGMDAPAIKAGLNLGSGRHYATEQASINSLWDTIAGPQPQAPDQPAQQQRARQFAQGAAAAIQGFDRTYPGVLSEADRTALMPQIQAALAAGTKPEALVSQLGQLYAKEIGAKGITRPGLTKPGAPGTPTAGPGGVDPQTLLDAAVWAYIQHQPDPQDTAYASDPTAYATDSAAWAKGFSSVVEAQQAYKDHAAGITRMQDGTIVSAADYAKLDPVARQQVDAWMADQQTQREAKYLDVVNSLGLQEFNAKRSGVVDENARRISDFTAANQRTATSIAYDQANSDQAARSVDRQLKGQAESRSRADLVTSTLEKNAPMATTPGKQDYTASDFGGLLAGLGAQAGVAPGATLLHTSGTVHLDPAGLLAGYDAASGVGGPLPTIPGLVTTPGDIPAAPTTTPIPQGGPAFQYPTFRPPAPVTLASPAAAPAAAVAPPPVIYGPGGQVMDQEPAYGLLG